MTRAREDRTRDVGSQFVYLRDVRTGLVWSAAYQPTRREPDEYLVTFLADKVVFRRRDEDIETQLEVAVSPEDDVEVRRLSLTNHGDRPREIEVTSYAEIVLGAGRRRPGPSRLREALHRAPSTCPRARPCSAGGVRARADEKPLSRSTR